MEEPAKSDIDAIFKRLKTSPANKVCLSPSISKNKFDEIFLHRHVSIVTQKIQHGHQSLMEYFYVLIVQQDIVVLVFIYHLFVRLTLILVGDGFNFGMFYSIVRFQLFCFFIFRAMQVGGNANAVSIFLFFL